MALPALEFQPITELDAVNMLLLSIGQSPVNTLVVDHVKDVSFARLTMHNTSREVQSRGWWFNQEEEFPITADGSGYIQVAPNVLNIDFCDKYRKLVQRGSRMYDMDNHTFAFPAGTYKFDLSVFLPWTDVPQVARNYIAVRAARIFQSQAVGSEILFRYDSQLEAEVYAEFHRAHLRNTDSNILASGASTNRIFSRRR